MMKKIPFILSILGLLLFFASWILLGFILDRPCRKLNDILSNSHDLAAVSDFLSNISKSEELARFLESTRGQYFSLSELPRFNVEIPIVLSNSFDDLTLYILTDRDGKEFTGSYRVLELGIGVSHNLLVFKNSNRQFKFGSDVGEEEFGLDLYSPAVRCAKNNR